VLSSTSLTDLVDSGEGLIMVTSDTKILSQTLAPDSDRHTKNTSKFDGLTVEPLSPPLFVERGCVQGAEAEAPGSLARTCGRTSCGLASGCSRCDGSDRGAVRAVMFALG
jgi:hypothetical protein